MSGKDKSDIRDLSPEELKAFFSGKQEKPFRASQVFDWLWKKECLSFADMTNLSKGNRDLLQENFTFHKSLPACKHESRDGTLKIGFGLHDNLMVEGVLIPSDSRFTACVSSQAGCPLGCLFCATGKMGFKRNLSAGEIFDQVAFLAKLASEQTKTPSGLSNIVYMGMGEPLLNFDNVSRSVFMLTSETGLGMSPQRITVSSVGIPKMIRQMANGKPKYHFALSLHSANNEKRNRLVPLNLRYPLEEITEAMKYYCKTTGNRFTIEYILFRDVNDALEDAKELAVFCKNFPVKINLIEYNPVEGSGFFRSPPDKMKEFAVFLQKKNLVVNIRKSKGKDIDAACGQLAGKINGEIQSIHEYPKKQKIS
jgi:23S rRNA (adenine2503-C2)-methyltransferase